jgi:hypothetical protein
MRDKSEERRQEKLAIMRQQIKNGTLVIRQMTDAERERYPARPVKRAAAKPRPRSRPRVRIN